MGLRVVDELNQLFSDLAARIIDRQISDYFPQFSSRSDKQALLIDERQRPRHHFLALTPALYVALFDENNAIILEENLPEEIRIKGPNVFLEYWNARKATEESFHDGWFCTGDVAVIEKGYYRIMGRSSVDIIKSGAYKISALEIENILIKHPLIKECAVVGLEDKKWGEIVAVSVTIVEKEDLSLEDLQKWSSDFLSDYKIPRKINIVSELPKNSMGKINKPEVKKSFST